MVFFDAKRPLVEWFRFRRMALLGARSIASWVRRDPAGVIADWVDIAKNWGALCNRWTPQYRRWAALRGSLDRSDTRAGCAPDVSDQ
jgi:hypothetical protein